MKRYTLDDLHELAERCRRNDADVVLDPVTVRSLVDATRALCALGDVELELVVSIRHEAWVDELLLAVDVARARFVDADAFVPSRAGGLTRPPASTAELDRQLDELEQVAPRFGRLVRRLFGRAS